MVAWLDNSTSSAGLSLNFASQGEPASQAMWVLSFFRARYIRGLLAHTAGNEEILSHRKCSYSRFAKVNSCTNSSTYSSLLPIQRMS